VGDSSYKLIPSAYRKEGIAKLRKEAEYHLKRLWSKCPIDTGSDIALCEAVALRWFYEKANRQGLRVPDIPDPYSSLDLFDVTNWDLDATFLEDWSGIAAVAQHYGIPTRMLDWTFDVSVALYFAIKDLPDKGSTVDPPAAVSLWALDRHIASYLGPEIRFVVPKYCDNPNIMAQSGLFTVLTGAEPGKDLETAIWDAYSDFSRKEITHYQRSMRPILKKVNIPYEDALTLKLNFKRRGISYDSVFPGWSGVVESMEIQSGVRRG